VSVTFTPTQEQQHALDLFLTGGNVVIDAVAGSGKTSVLQLIGAHSGSKRGLYAAFNRAIAQEAGRKFSGTPVTSKTMHSLAYAKFGVPMQNRLGDRRPVQWNEKARILGINDKYMFPSGHSAAVGGLSRQQLVGLTTATVKVFMQSAGDVITPEMVVLPHEVSSLKDEHALALRETIVGFANTYWDDLTRPDGKMRYDHGAYFKQFAMSKPQLPYDYILLDEAQDSDPLTVQIISEQDVQVVTVGDAYQSIYGWRGASSAMDAFNGEHAALTQSFRFGDAIAEYANSWLELLDAPLRIKGKPGADSSVFRANKRMPEAILTRTNAGAISEVVQAQTKGYSTAIAGEGKANEMRQLAFAAQQLQQTGATSHPELGVFNTWLDVVEYAKSDEGEDIKPLVEIIEKFSARAVTDAIDACVPTTEARVTVSTAHVSKGLEWLQVRIAEDFYPPRKGRGDVVHPIPGEEARLAYVAATRAMRHLDPRGFDWLPDYLASGGWVDVEQKTDNSKKAA
jgi:hypothetical protein